MSRHKLLFLMIIGLTLVAWPLVGCSTPPITQVLPTSKEAASTLVLPTATPSPETAKPAGEPTITPSMAIPSTTTPPPATPSPIASRMNEPVEGEEWEITVISAINKGVDFTATLKGLGKWQTLTATEPNIHFVEVMVRLKKLTGTAIEDSYLLPDIGVRDNVGSTYPWVAAGPIPGQYYDRSRSGEPQTVFSYSASETPDILLPRYIFAVPDEAAELYFMWPGLAPVLLEVATPTPTPAPTPGNGS